MYQAYKLLSVLKQGVQIESIAAYDDNVILGTPNGQLIMYTVNENDNVDMRMINKNFSKKSISQIEAIPSDNLLFILTDNMIHVCDIMEKNFNLIHISSPTKGCTLFAMDVKTPKSSTGLTESVIGLCCAIRRRLQFFVWKLDTLSLQESYLDLKDVPKAISWVDNVVCVGFRDEYILYNASTYEKHNLIAVTVDPCIHIIKKNLFAVNKDEYLIPININKYIKSKDAKLNVQGSYNDVVEETKLRPILWSGALLDFVYDQPFVLGRVSNAIEVRFLDDSKNTLVQNITELSRIKHLVRSGIGTVFAAGNCELWCLRFVDIKIQREQLLSRKNQQDIDHLPINLRFQIAIGLSEISNEHEDIKRETIRGLHRRFANHLYTNKEFVEAMTEFQKAAADPVDVIRLFPNLLPDQNTKATDCGSDNTMDIIIPTAPKPIFDDKDLENAITALTTFLVGARANPKNSSKSLLSIIDTTILKCYLLTHASSQLILSLLRLKKCHFEESEKTLKKHDKLVELVALYKINKKHIKALDLLKSESDVEDSCLYGPDHTIKYLKELGANNIELICEYADWVLTKYPKEGLNIFIDDLDEVDEVKHLPRASVLDFLLIRHKSLVITYLEHVVHVWHDKNIFINDMLITQYREKVQNLLESLAMTDITDELRKEKTEQLEKCRPELIKLLRTCENYAPEIVLKDFPTNIMLEERAIILGRLKKHEKVLAIYVQVLGDIENASKYCEENYQDDNEIFLTLLKMILRPSELPPYEGVKIQKEFNKPGDDLAVDILNKYAAKIDPSKILPFLPDRMPVQRLSNYLNIVLRAQLAEQNKLSIMKGLLSAEILRAKENISEYENQSVELTESTLCAICKKRFPNQSAFVRYPNGKVVHFACHNKRN